MQIDIFCLTGKKRRVDCSKRIDGESLRAATQQSVDDLLVDNKIGFSKGSGVDRLINDHLRIDDGIDRRPLAEAVECYDFLVP